MGIRILSVSIAHITHALLVSSMRMINKIEFFCDGCNLWSHGWCVSVSKLESKCLTEKSAQTWYRKTVKV